MITQHPPTCPASANTKSTGASPASFCIAISTQRNNQPFPLMLPSMNRLQSQPLHAGPLRTGLVFGQLLARCLGLAWLALLAASPGAHAAPVRLENAHVAVEVDAATGGLLSLHDKELQATYRMSGLGFRLETDRGTVRSSQLRLERHSPAALTLTTAGAEFAVKLHYRLGANDRFIEKWLEVKRPDAAPWSLQRAVAGVQGNENSTGCPGGRGFGLGGSVGHAGVHASRHARAAVARGWVLPTR